MNEPRTQAYNFRAFIRDGWAWLIDDSTRHYPCTARPHIWAEPLYPTDCETEEAFHEAMYAVPDGGYYLASEVEQMRCVSVMVLDHHEQAEREAWDEAHEEATSNHCL